MKVMKKKKQKKKIWNILREIWNWAQGQNLSFRGFWKLMEFNGKFNLKFNLMDVRITVRILIFGVSRVKMLIFLIFCAEAYTCWSARFARSRVGGVARLFKEISVFFSGSGIFSVFEFFGHFDSFVAFHHERAAFYHGKRPFLVILTHLWHFIISKNVVLGHFNKFRFLIIFSVFESLAASEIEQVASKYEKKRCF